MTLAIAQKARFLELHGSCNQCNQSALRKRKREWLGPSRIDKLILGILLCLGKGKVQVTSRGNRNSCFRQALFIKFAFSDFAVAVSYIGRGGVASRDANSGRCGNAMDVDRLTCNRVDISTRLVAYASRRCDATLRVLPFLKLCGDCAGTFRAHGLISVDFGKREIE